MSDYPKSTSPPVNRRKILTDAYLIYDKFCEDLRKADQGLGKIRHLLKPLSEGEQRPYLEQLLYQREAVHYRILGSIRFMRKRIFPKWVKQHLRTVRRRAS